MCPIQHVLDKMQLYSCYDIIQKCIFSRSHTILRLWSFKVISPARNHQIFEGTHPPDTINFSNNRL